MAIKHRESQDEFSEINIIPLVDIILVVLIIFMVIAPLVTKGSLGIKLPKSAMSKETKIAQAEILISESGELHWNQEVVDMESLKAKLSNEFSKNPDLQLTISADQMVPHGKVVAVLDLASAVGITQVGISVEKKSAP